MPNAAVPLTEEQLVTAKKLREGGVGYKAIAYTLGVGHFRLQCALRPGFREKRNADAVRLYEKKTQPAPIDRAKELLALGLSVTKIAGILGVSRFKLRCALFPNYREHERERCRMFRRGERKPRKPPSEIFIQRYGIPTTHLAHYTEPRVEVPRSVIAEREREYELRMAHNQTTNEAVLGDPPPWRSALGKRNEVR